MSMRLADYGSVLGVLVHVRRLRRGTLMCLIGAARRSRGLRGLQLRSNMIAPLDDVLFVLALEFHHFAQQSLARVGLLGALSSRLGRGPIALVRVFRMVGSEPLLDRLQGGDQLVLGADQSNEWAHLSAGDQFGLLATEVAQLQQASMTLVDQLSQVFSG